MILRFKNHNLILLGIIFSLTECTYTKPLLCVTRKSINDPHFEFQKHTQTGKYFCLRRGGFIGVFRKTEKRDSSGKVKSIQYNKAVNYKVLYTPMNTRFYRKTVRYFDNGEKSSISFFKVQHKKDWTSDTLVNRIIYFRNGKRIKMKF